jgi:hypothetical protein
MKTKSGISNFVKGAILSTALLSGANKFANAQTFNDPSYFVPNYIQTMKEENLKKGQLTGAKCFFSFNNHLYYLWGDGRIISETGESFFNNNGKFVSDKGTIMPNEFNKELQKAINIVDLKEKKDNARVVDYFTYTNPKTNENNVFMVFSDGTVGFKYGFYSMGMNGSFYDENNNKVFDGKDILMSDNFSEKYASKLEETLSRQGSPSQLVFLPIDSKERTDMNNSLLNYKLYKNQKGKDKSEDNINVNKKDQETKTIFVENPYNPKPLEDRVNFLTERVTNLENKPSPTPITTIIEKNVENPYDDSEIKKDYNNKIQGLSKEVENFKIDLAASLVGVSQNNKYFAEEKYNELFNKYNELSNKFGDLEKSLISTKLDIESLYSDKKGNTSEPSNTIQSVYDDSKIRGEIQVLNEQMSQIQSYMKTFEDYIKNNSNNKTEIVSSEKPNQNTTTLSEGIIIPSPENSSKNDKPKETIIESKDNPHETVIESKGTQISTIIGSDEVQKLDESKKPYEAPNKKTIKRNPGLYFTAEPLIVLDKDGYAGMGVNTGIIYNFNDTIGLGAKLSLRGLQDRLLESYTGEVSPITKRYAQGTKTSTNRTSIGGDLELRIGPVIFGAGANIESGIENTLEQIIKQTDEGNQVLRSNTSSIGYSVNSVNGYIGLDLPINENLTGRVFVGYENQGVGKDRGFIGIGTSIKLGNKSTQDKKE